MFRIIIFHRLKSISFGIYRFIKNYRIKKIYLCTNGCWTVYLKSDVKINQFLRFDDDILTAIENPCYQSTASPIISKGGFKDAFL